MSRVGKMPVEIPQGVKVSIGKTSVEVEGPKGKLSQGYMPEVKFELKDDQCIVTRKNDSKRARAMHGLYRNLLNNMVEGVSKGFQKNLLINGVGYRAEMAGKSLVLNLGFSNPIEYLIPEGINVALEGNNKVMISGIDKAAVGQVAAEIRSIRPPEPYKGKGVKYEDEHIRRKVGKSGVK